MSIPILSIVDPLHSLFQKADTSLAVMREFLKQGASPFACQIEDIFIKDAQVHFLAAKVSFHEDGKAYYAEKKKEFSASYFPLILMRKDPPVDQNFMASLLMLRLYDKKKTKIVNDPEGLLLANEKLFGLSITPQFFPSTVVSANFDVLYKTADEMKDFVLKPCFCCGGSGVLVLNKDDKNLISSLELLSDKFTTPIIMQEYIKNAFLGDKRIFLLGGEILGAVLRKPKKNDHRSNCHVGGMVFDTTITDVERKMVKELKPHLLSLGLHLVGIDVIDEKLTEINVTSPTCILEMENLTGKNLTTRIVNYLFGL